MKPTEELMQKSDPTSRDVTGGTRRSSRRTRLRGTWTQVREKLQTLRNDDDLRHIRNGILDRQLDNVSRRIGVE